MKGVAGGKGEKSLFRALTMKQQSILWLFVEILNFEFPIDFFSNFIKVAEGQWYWWNKDFILEFAEQNWNIRTNFLYLEKQKTWKTNRVAASSSKPL